jgi:hypothetical protein
MDVRRTAMFLVEGGQALELVRAHIAEVQRVRRANAEVCAELGLPANTRARIHMLDGRLLSINFAGNVPEGWTKPDKHGCSSPKKGTAWWKRFGEMKGYADQESVISKAFGVPLSASFSYDGGTGVRAIGSPFNACGWLWLSKDGPYVMWTPDVPAIAAEMEAAGEMPDAELKAFKLEFEGCRRILEEEWKLMVAQHELAQKQRELAEAA